MVLQDWGAIGEMVGGVAVIVTLVYLAIQIRQYTVGMSSATFHSSMQGFNQINAMLGTDPTLARVLDRGMRDPDTLSEEEQYQFVWLMRCYVNIYENLYQQFAGGACPERYWLRYARELKQTLDSPGGRKFRRTNTTYVELYGYVDEMPPNAESAYGFALDAEPDSRSNAEAIETRHPRSWNPSAIAGTLAEMEFSELARFNEGGVGVFWSEAGGPSPWEMHPDCDEMLQVLEGEIEVEVLPQDGSEGIKTIVSNGCMIVVPQGCWHRQDMLDRTKELYLTPGRTLHSNSPDPRLDE